MKIGELFVQLGVQADTAKVKDFAKAIGELPLEGAIAIAALSEMIYKLGELGAKAMDTAIGFKLFTAQTGLSSQELQRWQMAAERVGVQGGVVADTIKSIQMKLAGLRTNPQTVIPFAMLGMNPMGKNPFQIMDELRGKIKQFPRDYFTFWSSQIGVAGDMNRVLELNDDQYMEFMNHEKGLTPRAVQDFEKLKEAITGVSQTFRTIGYEFLDELLLRLERMIKVLHEVPEIVKGISEVFKLLNAVLMVTLELTEKIFKPFSKQVLNPTTGKQESGIAAHLLNAPPAFPYLKDFGTFMDKLLLPNNFAVAGSTTNNVNMNFHGLNDTEENMIRKGIDALNHDVGIKTRVQIGGNEVKRQ